MRRTIQHLARNILLLFLVGVNYALAAPDSYIDETSFLADLSAMGYTPVHEGFESDVAWGDTTPRFFGVIDTDGFERFEYREMEGKLEIDGGDIKYIFSDDFYFVLEDPGLVFKNGFE